MNMTTKVENIPLKTNKSVEINDDSNDPMVQDILNEFQHEIELNEESSKQKNYNINYSEPQIPIIQQPQEPIPQKKTKKCVNNSNSFSNYYNDEYIRKSAIVIIIVAFVFSPIIYNSIFSKNRFADFFEENNFYVKLGLTFIIIYIMMFNNLV
jgi:hypothetical protein